MTSVVIHESRAAVTEADVLQLEQQLKATLPSDYRTFLLKHNGGYPDPNFFPITSFPLDDHGILEWLLCLEEGYVLDIRRHLSLYQNRIPRNLLPVARDPGGNMLCVAISGNDYGKVFYWDHEGEADEGAEPDYENVYFVAHSFDALISQLVEL